MRDPSVSSWKKLGRSGDTTLTGKQFVERHLDGLLRRPLTLTVTLTVTVSGRSVPPGRSGRYHHRAIPPIDNTPQQLVQPSLASQDLERRDEVRDGPKGEIGGFVAPG